MQQKADAFVVMPGGLGTLEEAFDTWNAIKIGVFNKPFGFLNIDGYYDGLFSFIANAEKYGYVSKTHKYPKSMPVHHYYFLNYQLVVHLNKKVTGIVN